MNTAELREQLILDEGLRLFPYTDAVGKVTLGVGHNLTDNGISNAMAMFILDEDIASHLAALDRELPWYRQLSENRQLVLGNMVFNLGITKLLMFKNTLDHIARGEYDQAADSMLASVWASQVGKRAQRLAEMMRAG